MKNKHKYLVQKTFLGQNLSFGGVRSYKSEITTILSSGLITLPLARPINNSQETEMESE